MREPTQIFVEEVQRRWGDPVRVAEAGLDETFRHEDAFGQDHDDQVNNAVRIGIMAGETISRGPQAFVDAFVTLLNNDV